MMGRTMWAAAAALLTLAAAQGVEPANVTSVGGLDMGVQIAHSGDIVDHWLVRPLTNATTPDAGLSGPVTFIDSSHVSNQLDIKTDGVVVLSCDQYSGNVQASTALETAIERNVSAIVLFSTDTGACSLTGASTGYDGIYIYTMNSRPDSTFISQAANADGAEAWIASPEMLANAASTESNGSNSGSGSSSQQSSGQGNSWGPSPSTAVAMIILYSITGIITALFLVIIITGAVRAHRHPERYGPRNIIGRPRQSRARGLARAMLETLPIVRVGESHEEGRNKPTDVELAQHGPVEMVAGGENPTPDATKTSDQSDAQAGIAPATERSNSTQADNLGCSICTEDFEVGQDQRVLPCDHRYHPACIDPWLLNVSGTCPLCRIDLRPQAADGEELDEAGNPIPREGDAMAPPLDGEHPRSSIRRSIMIGLTGIGRPERLTREERVAAIRRYTEQQRAAAEGGNGEAELVEEESRMRRRLRNAFRVRTRRAGADGQVQDVSEAAPAESERDGIATGTRTNPPA